MLFAAARGIADALFGGRCFLCRGSAREGLLCAGCDADLRRLAPERCPRCALPSSGGRACGRCLAEPPAFDATEAAVVFAFPADVLVHALKYRGELAMAGLMAGLLAPQVRTAASVDAIVPVPLAPARLRERGFNQALEIARPLAQALRVPLRPNWLQRVADTPALAGLPLAGRARAVRGAFRCDERLAGTAVALVDDVMTSGATLGAAAAALKRAGAARVVAWAFARTLPAADV